MGVIELTAFKISFIFPTTFAGPGGTCLPGMPITLIPGCFSAVSLDFEGAILTCRIELEILNVAFK